MYPLNHFEGYNSVASSNFTMLYNHHHRPLPELSHLPEWKSCLLNSIPYPSPWSPLLYFLF